jgi:hypothetical protein
VPYNHDIFRAVACGEMARETDHTPEWVRDVEWTPILRQRNKAHNFQRKENWVMGLSRRRFTWEFKEAAVRRLQMGVSVAEVERAAEVSPNALE